MTKRTSLTHPLQIAAVAAAPALGRVGVTFCPGKRDSHAMTGQWDRNLALDLDAVRAWGARAVVTLVEQKELDILGVPEMGDAVRARGMVWFHLPIVDVSTPDQGFEERWAVAGSELRHFLQNGQDVLVHCRGGLGRAGTIGARLLVELGMDPVKAIHQIRAVRPGAIETKAQENHVLRLTPFP